jgi:hypothetical protein
LPDPPAHRLMAARLRPANDARHQQLACAAPANARGGYLATDGAGTEPKAESCPFCSRWGGPQVLGLLARVGQNPVRELTSMTGRVIRWDRFLPNRGQDVGYPAGASSMGNMMASDWKRRVRLFVQRFWQPTSACMTCMPGSWGNLMSVAHWTVAL